MQWRSYKAGEIRKVECLLRKLTGSKQSHQKIETMRAVTRSAVGIRSPKLFGADITYLLPWILDMELWHVIFALLGFCLDLVPFVSIPLFLPLEWECLPCGVHQQCLTLFLILQGLTAESFKTQSRLWTWTFLHC